MRVLSAVLALMFVVFGLLFGALNPAPAAIDLYYLRFEPSLGVALLLAALIGALLAGLALALGVIWPLRRRLSRTLRELARVQPTEVAPAALPAEDGGRE